MASLDHIATDRRLTDADVRLLLILDSIAVPNGMGRAFVADTNEEIARECDKSVRTIIWGLGRLVRHGYVERIEDDSILPSRRRLVLANRPGEER